MRILVLSDTHRNVREALRIISFHSDIKHIFFLGDLVTDIQAVKEQYPDRCYHIVRGNCDFACQYPSEATEVIENTRIFYCHGNRHGVKHTTEYIKAAARENNCTLALFGHTHCSLTAYDNGLYLVNPGSVSASRDGRNSYGVIDITKDGIMPSILCI